LKGLIHRISGRRNYAAFIRLHIPIDSHPLRKSAMIAEFFVMALALPASAHVPGRMTGGGSIQ
jgi:hypothetical protein